MAKDKQDTTVQNVTDEQFDTKGLLLDYLSNLKWVILSVVICLTVAYFYVATQIPIYTVSTSIYLNNDDAAPTNRIMDGIDGQSIYDMSSFIDETEIEIMKSRNNLVKIVDSLNLAYQYFNVGALRDKPMYKTSSVVAELDSVSLRNLKSPITVVVDKTDDGYTVNTKSRYAGEDEDLTVDVKKLPARIQLPQGMLTLKQSPFTKKFNGTVKIVISNPGNIAARLSSSLTIEFAKNSQSILQLAYNTTVIEEGDDVLRALVDYYNRQMIEDKNRSAIQTEAFIIDRLVMISGELKDVENRLKEYREANNIANLDVQTSANISNLNNTEAQLASVDAEREILNDIERAVVHQDQFQTLPTVSNNQAVSQSIDAYNKAVVNYQRALETRGAEHPQVERMQVDLNQQKAQIVSNIAAAKNDVAARRRGIVSLDNRSSGKLAVQPTIDKGLNEIFREQQVKVNIYTFLLQKREEIALQKTLATPTAQFIDNPTGAGPVSPKKGMCYGLGLLIGLIIPAVIIAIKRILFPVFKDKEELERLTNVPVIGEICASGQKETVCVGEGVSTPVAELFRLLRNNINFVASETDKKVILVTSSVSGEGKTFVAINLAMTYALMGKKVVLVGMDIRRPALSRICGFTNARGVTTYLSGQESNLDSLIMPSGFNHNLSILPAGPIPPNPNELLLSNNMLQMINRLRSEYDYVIVDSAPIGLVSDTFLIIPHTDVHLYVTRAGVSTRNGLKVMHDAVRSGRMAHPYIILNGVNVQGKAYIYKRYGRYGYSSNTYGYAYGKKRDNTKNLKSFFKKLFKKNSKI